MVLSYWALPSPSGYGNLRIELGKGTGGQVMATGRPFRTDDYANAPRISKEYVAETLEMGIISQLVVPIQLAGRMEGLLYLGRRARKPFTDADEALLQHLATHAGIAITNALLAYPLRVDAVTLNLDLANDVPPLSADPHQLHQVINLVTNAGLYREVERQHPRLGRRFVFLTGDVLNAATRRFLEETGVPSVSKPFTLADIRQAIRQAFPSREGDGPEPSFGSPINDRLC